MKAETKDSAATISVEEELQDVLIAITAVKERTKTATHGIKSEYKSGMLFITLPSGRKLSYMLC